MSQNVFVLTTSNGSLIHLVGVTSSSDRSQEEVASVINTVKPSCVVIELCPSRRRLLSMADVVLPTITSPSYVPELKNTTKNVGIFAEIFEELVLNILCRDTNMLPGAEYRRAAIEAKKYCNHICLGDRPLSITISRLISTMGWIKTINCIIRIRSQLLKCVNEESVLEVNENNPIIENLIAEIASDYSEIEKVIFEERNKCFAYVLQNHAGIYIDKGGAHIKEGSHKVVGVVEINSIPGILKYWGTITKEEYDQLSDVLPESKTTIAIKFISKVSIYSILLWGIIKTSKALKRILI